MPEQLHLAAGQTEGGDVELQQLTAQLDPVPEHNVRPADREWYVSVAPFH